MFVKQNKDTFIRIYRDEAYITNQYTQQDRVYDEIGCDFLCRIHRYPSEVESIVEDLYRLYGNSASREEITTEFYAFIEDLVVGKFLFLADTLENMTLQEAQYELDRNNGQIISSEVWAESLTNDVMMNTAMNYHLLQGIQFELTGRCNERCIHCYLNNSDKDKGKDMPYEKVLDIIDQFADMGGLRITLSGGEVLLHRHLIDIIEYARSKDMMITLLSNVISLTDYHVQKFKENNISGIQVSLYSMSSDIHDGITKVKGSFERTKSSIIKLRQANVPVVLSCPLMKANYKDFRQVLDFGRSLGCKTNTDFTIMAQSDLDTSNLVNRLSIEEVEYAMRIDIENNADYTANVERLMGQRCSSVAVG